MLWAKQPIYFQVQFAIDHIWVLAPQHLGMENNNPFNSACLGHEGVRGKGDEKMLLDVDVRRLSARQWSSRKIVKGLTGTKE